ncbi:hypothetical protein [Enterococcus faecium]|uniref:hypothetical protein n=1 Tax=Enterococcus TaxID=1350 RepID=UPI00223B568A|nr:hypothetical protein [Enterococcus faecium]MCS8592843.1 hypothetical protein [Enterococcus faecium]
MRIGETAMNKLSKQESNVLKATFEKEYGVSTEEVYKVASQGVATASEVSRKLGFLYKMMLVNGRERNENKRRMLR